MQAIGLFAEDANPPLQDFEAVIIKFVNKMIVKNCSPENWDLEPSNHHAITVANI